MSLRDQLLPVVETIRGIPVTMGLRLHTVSLVTREWDGDRVGLGNSEDTETVVTVANGTGNVRVQQVTSRDVVASGGALTAQDLKVGPFTPGFVLAGTIDPPTDDTPREVFFRVTGPGMPDEGRTFRRVNDARIPNFSSMLYLTASGS